MKFIFILGIIVFLVSSCTAPRTYAQKPLPVPLIQQLSTAEKPQTGAEQPQGELTLPQALSLALQRNPQLSAYSLKVRALEAAALQAAFLPNPELDVEMENFSGSGPLSAFKSTETTVSLGQLIELAGKREKRVRIAALESDLAAYEYQSKQLDVFVQVVTSFNKVLVAQEFMKLNRDLLALAGEFKENIARRVQAGRLSPAELSRADVEVANARIALQRGKKTLDAARQELTATWGAVQANFSAAVGNLARAGRIPDVFLSAGWRKFNESGEQAFVAGLSIPLPLFNRNQGALQEASFRLKQSEWQERSGRLQLETMLNRRYQMLLAAYESLQSLKEKIIPQARQAFETINNGYRQGKFGFLDVLDARRTLFASREAYLRNIADYQLIRAQIERLIGQSIENIN